ncbi:YqaH family protein, partial [Bacillus paralicheniformis]
EIAATIILNCKDLKRMEHPEQVVRLHEIASKFANRGLNVSTVRRVYQ